MKPFRFVHAADLHLDTPFRGVSRWPSGVVNRLVESSFDAFDRIVTLCLDEGVDALLLAGDSSDRAERSLRAEWHVRERLKRLSDAGIVTCIVRGNHDPLAPSDAGPWPPGTYVFGPEVGVVPIRRDGEELARVYGISYRSADVRDNLARSIRREPNVPLAIGLLHANVGSNPDHDPYAPCQVEDLVAARMDYWALGHVHAPAIVRERGPMIAYAGTPQGRHIRELGPRGCWLVTAREGREFDATFVETDVVRWESISVDVSGAGSDRDVADQVAAAVSAVASRSGDRSLVVRITLTGPTHLHAELSFPGALVPFVTDLERTHASPDRFVLIETVRIETHEPVDAEGLREEPTLAGEVVRVAEAIAASSEVPAGVRAVLHDIDVVRAELGFPRASDEEVRGWLSQAMPVAANLLRGPAE